MEYKFQENFKNFFQINQKFKNFLLERIQKLEKNTIDNLKEIEKLKNECFSITNKTNLKDKNKDKVIEKVKVKEKYKDEDKNKFDSKN